MMSNAMNTIHSNHATHRDALLYLQEQNVFITSIEQEMEFMYTNISANYQLDG